MNLDEISVLNRGIDQDAIIGLPKGEFLPTDMDASPMLTTKSELIGKGILLDYNNLSEVGVKILSRMKAYKNAEFYLHYQNLWLGVVNQDITILLKEAKEGDYRFEVVETPEILEGILQKHAFLIRGNASEEECGSLEVENDIAIDSLDEGKEINADQVFYMYYLQAEDGFFLETIKKHTDKISELYFVIDEAGYRYDCRNHKMFEMSYSEIRKRVKYLIEQGGLKND